MKDLELLRNHGFIEMKNKFVLPKPYGEIMAKYYLKFETVVNFIGLDGKASSRDIVHDLKILVVYNLFCIV